MSTIVNSIFNEIYGLAFEATRAVNPIASFAYPFIFKREISKYFSNYINSLSIINKENLKSIVNEKIKKWKYYQDENPKLFIQDALDFINKENSKYVDDEKRKKVKSQQSEHKYIINIRKGRKRAQKILDIRKKEHQRKERSERRRSERKEMKRRIKDLKGNQIEQEEKEEKKDEEEKIEDEKKIKLKDYIVQKT
jgi:hypothetical protein